MGACHCSRRFATCLPQKCLFGNVGELTPNDFLADGLVATPSPPATDGGLLYLTQRGFFGRWYVTRCIITDTGWEHFTLRGPYWRKRNAERAMAEIESGAVIIDEYGNAGWTIP